MGSPSEFKIGVALGIRPCAFVDSWSSVSRWGSWLRLRTFSMEA